MLSRGSFQYHDRTAHTMRPAYLSLQFTCWPGTALAAFACNRLSWDCLGGDVQYPQEHQALDVVSVLGDSMLAHLHCRHAVTFYTAYSQFASKTLSTGNMPNTNESLARQH